ncbi:hypothetical protein E4U53_003984 [Claviceps sorghi]|nr:hypothetical protein E4U53_003984 [Claviceps sorghi]
MASVTSLDKDLRRLRLEKYTPAAANEARVWIEEALGQKLSSSDLLEGLKDGVALCKLINLGAPPPGIRFKQSTMPFVQMENISHFLRACQSPPFNLHQHDMFLTVDLYERKDPAQVLQCLGAFSRAAHDADPRHFPEPIGPKNRAAGGTLSPQASGCASPKSLRGRGGSVHSNSPSAYPAPKTGETTPSARRSPAKSPTVAPASPTGPVSSWSKREHERSTAPAWNIAQYGYMGGASQGNLGISFGGMRQITSAGPRVPTLAEKERKRKVEAERQEEADRQRRAQLEAEEEAARQLEERKWEEETQRLREEERRKAAEEKQRWEEQERQWKLAEEKRRREEEEAAAKLDEERKRARSRSAGRLRGQFLSQYQAEQAEQAETDRDRRDNARIRELEKELEQARLREEEYERERQTRSSSRPVSEIAHAKPRSRSRHRGASPTCPIPSAVGPQRGQNRYESWTTNDEREYLANQHGDNGSNGNSQNEPAAAQQSVEIEAQPRLASPRPLPDPNPNMTPKPKPPTTSEPVGSRPLPNPAKALVATQPQTRTEVPLASDAPPAPTQARQTYARELGAIEERDSEDRRRLQSQAPKAGGWASKSLLEREMEMERQRQQEWEEAQKATAKAVRPGGGVEGIGGGIGGRWDVGQWSGFTGGDSQNKGSQGIGSARRQIAGPRPLPGANR